MIFSRSVFKRICRQSSDFAKIDHDCSRSYQFHMMMRRYAHSGPTVLEYPIENIRNFCIIAHVDHGKSTLADRLLELTGAISSDKKNEQVLDTLIVERSRGITIKAQTASLFYHYKNEKSYLLNLIDTPGHVDFNYEVSRSLAACQGAILVVDAKQGIQAQTVANFWLAFSEGLSIIPVINKIDIQGVDVAKIEDQIVTQFELPREKILKISAKTGLNVDLLLEKIVEELPPPKGDRQKRFLALLFDSYYDDYRGVVCYFDIVNGKLSKGDCVLSFATKKNYEVLDLGLCTPKQISLSTLYAGQVGYVVMGMKTPNDACIGDTFYHQSKDANLVEPLPGFQKAKSMVFAGVFPIQSSEYHLLKDSLDKLTLNDSSVNVTDESSSALGRGWRLGFLGSLHMDVFKQRLESEYSASIIFTAPTVPYQIQYSKPTVAHDPASQLKLTKSVEDFPNAEDMNNVESIREPVVLATIVAPQGNIGKIMALCLNRRGTQKDMIFLDHDRFLLKVQIPLAEIIVDFYDQLKSISSGYASFDYEECGYEETELVKVQCLLNHKVIPDLSLICHRSKSMSMGKSLVSKLKAVVHRQLFDVAIQASIGSKVIARETISALKKDVTAKCVSDTTYWNTVVDSKSTNLISMEETRLEE